MNRHDMNYGKLVVLGDIASDLLQDAEWWSSDDEELVDAYNEIMGAYWKTQRLLKERTTKDATE